MDTSGIRERHEKLSELAGILMEAGTELHAENNKHFARQDVQAYSDGELQDLIAALAVMLIMKSFQVAVDCRLDKDKFLDALKNAVGIKVGSLH